MHELTVSGGWPEPDSAAVAALAVAVAAVPDGAVVLLDGLLASSVPEVVVPAADRLKVVVLLHMPAPDDQGRERAVLRTAAAVIATSRWTKSLLTTRLRLDPELVTVAEPGVDPAAPAVGTPSGGELLCVGAVAAHKGQDVLFAALALIADLDWRCVCVGSLVRDPVFVGQLRQQARRAAIAERVTLSGPCTGTALDAGYARADLLVVASHAETYGMVVTEALARGLPVVATAVGGVPDALGRDLNGHRPGLLVPPNDPVALSAALRGWLGDRDLRRELRRSARRRRTTLTGWSVTAEQISGVLTRVAG